MMCLNAAIRGGIRKIWKFVVKVRMKIDGYKWLLESKTILCSEDRSPSWLNNQIVLETNLSWFWSIDGILNAQFSNTIKKWFVHLHHKWTMINLIFFWCFPGTWAKNISYQGRKCTVRLVGCFWLQTDLGSGTLLHQELHTSWLHSGMIGHSPLGGMQVPA